MFPHLERYYRSLRSGTTALCGVVLPLEAVLPLTGRGTTALYQFPPYSYLSVILFARVLWLMLVLSGCLCVCVCGSR